MASWASENISARGMPSTDMYDPRLVSSKNNGPSSPPFSSHGEGAMSNDFNLSANQGMPFSGFPTRPFFQSAEMSQMTALMYQQLVASATGRGQQPSGLQPSGGVQQPSAASMGATDLDCRTSSLPDPMSQEEQEDELIMQLLISRRERQMRLQSQGVSSDSSNRLALANDLLRLRNDSNPSGSNQRSFGNSHPFDNVTNNTYAQDNGMNPFSAGARYNASESIKNSQQRNDIGMGKNDYTNYALGAPMGSDELERIDKDPANTRILDMRGLNMQMSNELMSKKRHFDKMKFNLQSGGMMNPHQFMGHDLSQESPVKRKRVHKKKPKDMPRRPLSAYNLFFSEERGRILREIEEQEKGEGGGAEDDRDKPAEESSTNAEGKKNKPQALLTPLLPCEKKRRKHRKTHGKISFQQLAQKVGQRWKALSPERRKYYQDLAEEDLKRQKKSNGSFLPETDSSIERRSNFRTRISTKRRSSKRRVDKRRNSEGRIIRRGIMRAFLTCGKF